MVLGSRSRLPAVAIVCLLASASLLSLASARPAIREPSVLLVTLVEDASASEVAASHSSRVVAAFEDAQTYAFLARDASGLRADARVLSVEPEGTVRSASASWDRASWDTASWDRASWDTASWDRASWDRASWDADDDASLAPGELVWGLAAIDAPRAWSHGNPEGARTVCLVDSGIDAHARLAPRLWRASDGSVGFDFVHGDPFPDDEGGHGTHLAGIMAATPSAEDPFRGVAAPLLASAKVLDATGVGATSSVIAGISWCSSIRANVILLAFTEDSPTRALKRAVQAAQAEGALVVASAGNAGPCDACVSYPAAYPRVLAVAAAAPDGSIAAFSSKGPQVSIAAPGVDVASTFPSESYRVGSGTSQAAAFVAGAAALVWSQDPTLKAHQVASLLTRTAVGQEGRDAGAGFGLLDVGAASAALSARDR